MKFTEEQKEVLALLPQNIRESNELTDAAKLILANIMLWNGTEHAKNEGYIFRTNKAMKEDTGIKSEKTIIAAVNKLAELGLIERKAGQRKAASEYRLNTVKIENYTVKIDCKNTVKNYSNKLQYKTENYSKKLQYKNYSNNEDLLLIINELQEKVEKLQYKITVIEDELLQYKNTVKNYSENKNYSTDIESDIESDIEKEHENINYNGNNMIYHEKNNLKENEINFKVDHDKEISKDNENLNLSENEGITETEDEINSSSEVEETEDNETEISFFDESDSNTSKDDENFKVHFENGNFVVSETENESISSEVEQDNENNTISESQDSDMKTDNEKLPSLQKNESISNTSKDMEKYNSDENFKVWGKIQHTYDYATNKLEEYRFTVYESLHARKDYAGKYTQVKDYIDIEADELKSFAIPSQGTFGILTRLDGKYSFIVADSDVTLTNENKNSDEITTKGGGEERKKDDNTTETEKTSYNTPQSLKTSEVEQLPTEAKKVAPTQSQIANTQCNEDVAYLTTGVSAEEWDEITHKHGSTNNKKAWMNKVINFHGKQTTVSDALNIFHEKNKDGKEYMECNTFFYHFDNIMNEVQKYIDKDIITEEQKEDYEKVFVKLTKGKVNYWKAVFRHRSPRPNFPSEKRMWEMTGCIEVEETSNNAHTATQNAQVGNYTTKTIINAPTQSQKANTQSFVTLPNLNELYQLSYSDAVAELQKFVKNNPNISRKQKEEFNINICSAFGINGLYEF